MNVLLKKTSSKQIKILSIYGVSIFLGVLVGIVGSLFQLSIQWADVIVTHCFSYVHAHGGSVALVSAVISMLMLLTAYFMVKTFSPEASGSGVQEIEGALLHERPILWRRLLPVKFLGGVLTISSQMVAGREGPTIQMGGNLGEMLGEAFHFTRKRRDALIAAGAAAGLAVAFNAPLAGVLFVLEEMRNQFNFSFLNFKMVAICCVMSTVVLHLILGSQPAISMAVFSLPSLQSLWLFFLFGILVGFAALLFNVLLMSALKKINQWSSAKRYTYVVIVGLCVGYLACAYPAVAGGGYSIIETSLTMTPTFWVLSSLIIVRFILTIICYGTGAPGGVFAPMLALGTLLGLAMSYILEWLTMDASVHPGMFAVAGMGAFFSASVRAPITGIVLIVEMTQNYSLILPLMVTCLTSTTVMQLCNNPPLYTQLLRGLLLKKDKEAVSSISVG